MGDYYLGEIRLFPYNKIPKDWVIANGAILEITKYQALYSLLGIQFGGNGTTTFALPNLQGRVAVGAFDPTGQVATTIGGSGGADTVSLTLAQLPPHNHGLYGADTAGTIGNPQNAFLAQSTRPSNALPASPPAPQIYQDTLTPTTTTTLNPFIIDTSGAGAGHENRQPYLALVYAIATAGLYPQRP